VSSNLARTKVIQRGYSVGEGTHGSTMAGPDQTHVDPGVASGKVNYGISDSTRTYYTAKHAGRPEEAEKKGWDWAVNAVKSAYDAPVPLRPVLHHVETEGVIDVDRNINPSGDTDAMTAERLRITDTDWIPDTEALNIKYSRKYAGEDIVGVQGTLPHVNWNEFDEKMKGRMNYNTDPLGANAKVLVRQPPRLPSTGPRPQRTRSLPGQERLL
jgi:hypothetical protein